MCTTKKLLAAEQHFGFVTQCDCGTLHLTIGSVSLALDQEALQRVYHLAGEALKQLPRQSDNISKMNGDASHTVRVH